VTAPALAPDDLAVLRFAGQWWRTGGAREQAIVDQFGVTPVRFYQRLNQLLDTPAAAAAEPVLVARLIRIRDGRRVRLARGRAHARTAR
jgi:hypothetical protein